MHARRIASTLLAVTATAAVLGAGTAQAADRGHRIDRHRAVVELGMVHRSIDAGREWITLTNTTRRTLDLRGWTLSDRDGHFFRIEDLRLRGYQSVRVHSGRGHGHGDGRDVYQGRHRALWDRSDTATLRDARGRIVDQESWGIRRDHDHDGDDRTRNGDHRGHVGDHGTQAHPGHVGVQGNRGEHRH